MRLFMGYKPGVGSVLKGMKNNADDPISTPNTDYGKFWFNSETTKISYLTMSWLDYDPVTFPPSGSGNQFWLPPGSDTSTAQEMVSSTSFGGGAVQQRHLFCTNYPGYGYQPFWEFRRITKSVSYRRDGPTSRYIQKGQSGSPVVKTWGVYRGWTGYEGSTDYWTKFPNRSDWDVNREGFNPLTQQENSGSASLTKYLQTVWQLPVRNVAMPDYSASVVAGQEILRLNPAITRLALPGRTIADTNMNYFHFHENKTSPKIVKGGDIFVAAGGSATISTGAFALEDTTYMDYHVKKDGFAEMFTPSFNNNQNETISFYYDIGSNSVTLYNNGNVNIWVRYIILTEKLGGGFSTGGNRIILRGNDGIQDYIQIKRPGSSDTAPTIKDILVDTRLTYMPIIAEGFLPWSSGFGATDDVTRGEAMTQINFTNNGGFLPFVKLAVNFPNRVRLGTHDIFTSNFGTGWDGRTTCDSALAAIGNNYVKLYMSGSNPYDFDGSGSVIGPPLGQYATGLRYYIFAIPQ